MTGKFLIEVSVFAGIVATGDRLSAQATSQPATSQVQAQSNGRAECKMANNFYGMRPANQELAKRVRTAMGCA